MYITTLYNKVFLANSLYYLQKANFNNLKQLNVGLWTRNIQKTEPYKNAYRLFLLINRYSKKDEGVARK